MDTVIKTLKGICVLSIVVGVICGIINGNASEPTAFSSGAGFSWLTLLFWTIGGIISGTLFYGFAAVIELLEGIDSNSRDTKKDLHHIKVYLNEQMNEKKPTV